MDTQQSYSHGLLYSIAPDNFSSLRLTTEDGKDEFDWKAYEADYLGESLFASALDFIKTTAIMWGLIK